MSRSKRPRIERFIIFLIDGVSASTFDRFVRAGRLLTLARYVREGSYHKNVVASFPSVTGPGHIPLFSGINPASIDFVGHNQFDRKSNRLENYLLHYKKFDRRFGERDSLYRRFNDSVSLGEPFKAGATQYRKNFFALADWANIRGPANWYVLRSLRHEYKMGRDLIVAWLHETDALAHLSTDERRIEKSLIDLDRFLAKFEKEVDDKTTFVFCSDHGMEKTNGRPFSLKLELRKLGHKLGQNRLFLDGGGFGQVYFRKDGSYKERLGQSFLGDLPAKLVLKDPVGLALYRSQKDNRTSVVVRSNLGESIIYKQGQKYFYYKTGVRDPLNLINDQNEATFKGGLDRQELLGLTGSSNYPDGVFQIYEQLMAPSSGDLLVTSAPGYGFNLLTRFAVHGGPSRAQSVTFFLFNKRVDGLEQGVLTTADLPKIILANRG